MMHFTNYKILIFILGILTFSIACKDTNSNSSPEISASPTDSSPQVNDTKNTPGSVQIYTWVNKLRVRATPDTDSEIVAELAEGEALTYLDEKTDFTQKISMRGSIQDEPWLKIRTKAGKTGWVYGGGVKFYRPEVDAAPSPFANCFRAFAKRGNVQSFQICMDKVGAKQLKKDHRFVKKEGNGLVFTLLSGQKKHLSWAPGGQDIEGAGYYYRYYIPKMGFFVVEQKGVESNPNPYLLINDKSGREIPLWGFPKAAPDYKHLLVGSADIVPEFEAYGLRVYAFSENGFGVTTEWPLEKNRAYQPTLMQWINEQKAAITFRPLPNNPGAKVKILNFEYQATGSWRLLED